MSSHREAPEISKDPVADSTDLYAFVSPDQPDTVTIIANYIPLQGAAGGPNFYEFGDDVKYEINIDTLGHGKANITYEFRFRTQLPDPETFLYNTGPIEGLQSKNWNRRQLFNVFRTDKDGRTELGKNLVCPPCNIGPLSTPNYAKNLGEKAVHTLSDGSKVFAGQRAEGFYVDLGSIFDLGNLRPLQQANVFAKALGFMSAAGVNATKLLNVHSIAIQVPISRVHAKGRPTIGIWTTASRQKVQITNSEPGRKTFSGPFVQVSRLGMPLINEVIIPLGHKDRWNTLAPDTDSQFAKYVGNPELANLLPVLYPGAFDHLAALTASLAKAKKPRADLEAILLTGIPGGIVPGFSNFTGTVQADMLRLNTSIKPSSSPKIMGLLGGDAAGFPNGRRVFDDVVSIELQAIAGAVYPLIDPKFKPDAVVPNVSDGLAPSSLGTPFLDVFPYLGVPFDGYDDPSS